MIRKKETKMREPISVDQRLLVTLRYLATGDAHTTIAANYRMSSTTVGRIIYETCNALWDKLKEMGFMKTPCTESDWKKYLKILKIDGTFLICWEQLMESMCRFSDANYKFTLVDIGDSGRQSDGSVYANSNLGYAIENKLLNMPTDGKITHSTKVLPHVFVGDDAFGLKRHMMKPYPFQTCLRKLIFNYRLSRARRVIENAFGICASRFRVFHRPIVAKVDNVIAITKAVVALHNFLMSINEDDDSNLYCPPSFADQDGQMGNEFNPGEWRQDANCMNGLGDITDVGASNNYGAEAKWVREQFANYFNNEGAVDWQWQIVRCSK
ncbi:uncharacterized protein LOC124456087 [Xenia sp. Carnegie-2017]|uniref:uncharacterized protein LOC124456087 n=1 Tax=Xenia sp. Carnegie-2017 TaxID=2897299 RepID=UPI001F037A72|nr:uncharacterized protein LOC124456087 [Xenia sp. Carnegie-2017]